MWRVNNEGVWYWCEYPEEIERHEYGPITTTTATTWINGSIGSSLHDFVPRPRCIFDEK